MVSRKRKEQEVRDAKWISASAKEVIDYMNTSDPRPFAAVICRNFAAAVEAVNKLPPDKRRRELIILEAIKKDPKPYYGPSRSRKTPRIFARGRNSIPQLQKTIRKVLTKGWYEADLKSVQLAINAVLWGAEQTRRFLEDDGNVWETLFDYLQIPPDKKDIAKGAFKTTIYAIWFDRDAQLVGPILSRVLSRLGAETEGNAIYSIPMIREMLQEREHAKARIAHDGGVTDCNGRWIKLGKGRDAASLMAEAAQVAEMELLLPAIRLAKTTDEFQITLYQHDGFSVFFRRNKEQWRESIDKEVNKKAKEMGFPTGLDWEEL